MTEMKGPKRVVLGRNWVVFGIKTPVFALNLTKFDYGFEDVLLISERVKWPFAPKREMFFI